MLISSSELEEEVREELGIPRDTFPPLGEENILSQILHLWLDGAPSAAYEGWWDNTIQNYEEGR